MKEKDICISSNVPCETMTLFSSFSREHKDICMEILSRLDIKSLSRFKVVSKTCHDFLCDPSFIRFYSERRPSITGFFYQSSIDYVQKLRYVLIDADQENITDWVSCLGPLDDHAVLQNSCNGILHWVSSWDIQFISNPFTQKTMLVPWPVRQQEFFASGIAFNPRESCHFEILVLKMQSRYYLKPFILSSYTMRWIEMEGINVLGYQNMVPFNRARGLFLNSAIHWELTDNMILLYDMHRHSARLKWPPFRKELAEELGFSEPGCIGECDGKLHYCRVIGSMLCVWMECRNSILDSAAWVGKYYVNLNTVMNFSHGNHGCQALAYLHECRGVLLSLDDKIVAYEFEDSEITMVYDVQRYGGGKVKPSMIFPFVHSLALFDRWEFSREGSPESRKSDDAIEVYPLEPDDEANCYYTHLWRKNDLLAKRHRSGKGKVGLKARSYQ